MRRARGFSLLEIVIVVVIIGVIGAIAIPRLSRASQGVRVGAFAADLNTFSKAIDRYELESGQDAPDTVTGKLPVELHDYINQKDWEELTPLGGYWDIERDEHGVTLAIGVHYLGVSGDVPDLRDLDREIDDGNLSTGRFQRLDTRRFYLIIEP